jgi:hypothetical protein
MRVGRHQVGFLAVLADEHVGCAVNVDLAGHELWSLRTAARASEAVMPLDRGKAKVGLAGHQAQAREELEDLREAAEDAPEDRPRVH